MSSVKLATGIVHQPEAPPRVLSIAGSDSGGGAGIQADLKTFTALSTYGLTAITALTSQNTLGVHGVHAVPPEFVASQIKDVVSDIGLSSLKTGMLSSSSIIETVASTLSSLYPSRADLPPLVIDPVMISTSGHSLLDLSALTSLRTALLPLCAVLTPNVPEAEHLLAPPSSSSPDSHPAPPDRLKTVHDLKRAASDLAALGPRAVLVKGGHLPFAPEAAADLKADGDVDVLDLRQAELARILEVYATSEGKTGDKVVIDVLYERELAEGRTKRWTAVVRPLVESTSTHGTGCTLSAALAAYLGKGYSIRDATIAAVDYTRSGITTAFPLGRGKGPLNHLHSIRTRPLPSPSPSEPHPFTSYLLRAAGQSWDRYVNHAFIQQLGAGTLKREHFVHYIRQDYVYLMHYARIHSLAGYKSDSFEDLEAFATITNHVARESKMHIEFCATWGITLPDLLSTPESTHSIAYTRYLADVGHSGTLLDLLVAVASCLLGYGEVGLKLKRLGEEGGEIAPGVKVKKEGNPYWRWIEDYAGDDYQQALVAGIASLERRAALDPPSPEGLKKLSQIFTRCCDLEAGFWQMGLDIS